jgi:uncharacterized protein (DUF934 family)
MRRIIKDQRIVADDCQHLPDDAPVPSSGRFSLSLARWQKGADPIGQRLSDLGLRIPNDFDAAELAGKVDGLALIVLEFPKFGDGRALSQARVLREQLGFRGEIRATGDVLRDQMFFMQRCGINAFEPRSDRSLEDALKAFSEFSLVYQASSDSPLNVFRRRAGA